MINLNIPALEHKLTALKISGTVVKISSNDFYDDIYISFADDITFNKVNARKKDIEIFFNTQVNLVTDNGYIVIRIAKTDRPGLNLFSFLNPEIMQDNPDYILPLAIGQNENGDKMYYDLVKCPHLLIGGSTGSGKSVFLNNCIISTIYSGKSSLCLIDVKRVEFSIYEDIPTLAAPIAYDVKTAKTLLKNICFTMDNRYKELQKYNCRSIAEYNQKGYAMQYITVVIDEIADLFRQDKTIQDYVIRIAQLGRAAGIHLILATQRPDSQTVNGLIRSNVPSRVCFAVQKATDSRIILDATGGEFLKGKGDGLFNPIGTRNPIRFQAPYIGTESIQKFVDYLKK